MWKDMEMLVHMLMCEIVELHIDKSVSIVWLHLHESAECENTYGIAWFYTMSSVAVVCMGR